MTELELIIDLHKNSARQGPGSEVETLKALGCMDLPRDPGLKIADIGCGSGGQTLTLAQHVGGQITAVDLFPAFLDELAQKAKKSGLQAKIQPLEASMDALPFRSETFDVIWSEGAIYQIGFERGIREWKRYLKIGGYLAVSEITWISHSRPKEIETYWMREYPEIDTAANKINLLERHGYALAGYFYLRQASWRENYYKPLEARWEDFLSRNAFSALAKKVVADYKTEIEMYEKFKDHFSYGFYIARRDT